jgi:hypothetical protein
MIAWKLFANLSGRLAMKRILCVAMVLCGALAVQAGGASPLQLSICPPVQLVPEDVDVFGLKLNLPYGHNRYVTGIDLGVVGGAERCEAIQVNLFNVVPDRAAGVSVGLFNLMGSTEGVHCALINSMSEEAMGLQVAILNNARRVTGLQVGVVNRCDSLLGIQIGLANIAMDAPMPFTVLINAAF